MTDAMQMARAVRGAGGPSLHGRGTHDARRAMTTLSERAWFHARVWRGACSVIELSGELDLAGAPVLESAARELDLPTVRAVVLDLRRLVFIDAAGLNAVLELYAQCASVATVLTIIPGPRSVQRLFELTRLDRQLPFSHP